MRISDIELRNPYAGGFPALFSVGKGLASRRQLREAMHELINSTDQMSDLTSWLLGVNRPD